MRTKNRNQFLAILLSVVMILSLLVVPASAAMSIGEEPVAETPTEVSGGTPEADRDAVSLKETAQLSAEGEATVTSWTFSAADFQVEANQYNRTDATAITYNGLTISAGAGAYNGSYCYLNSGHTVAIPVTGKCNVDVSTQYGSAGTATMSDGTNAAVALECDGTGTVHTTTYHYATEAPGTVTISATGTTYLTKIEITDYTEPAPAMKLDKTSATLTVGGSNVVITPSYENIGATITNLTAVPMDSAYVTATVNDEKTAVTLAPVAEGTTTVTITATVDGVTDPLTGEVSVTVNPALPEGIKVWNFKEDGIEGAKAELDYSASGISAHGYGMMFKSTKTTDEAGAEVITTATIGIPVDGPSKVTVYAGYTWNLSLGDAQDPARYGAYTQATANTPDSYKELEFIYPDGAGKVILTAGVAEPTTYIEWIKVEPIDSLGATKVQVWDFGPDALNPAVFENMLTVNDMNAWFGSDITPGTDNTNLPATFSTGDFSASSEKTNNRLRTTNESVTRYDSNNGRSAYAENAADPYDTVTSKATGQIASNGGDITVALANTKAGDKVTYVLNENSSGELEFTVTDGASKETSLTKPAGEAVALSVYASADGSMSIHRAGTTKPVYVRIYREPPAATTVSGSIAAEGIPAGYKLVLTNDDSGVAYEATVADGKYSVDVARYRAGTSYTLSIADAEGWIVAVGDKLDISYTETTKTHDVTAVSVELVTISGTITGMTGETDLARLAFEVTKPDEKIYQPQIELSGAAFSAKFEKDVAYTLTALNANDYKLDTTSVTYSADATDATIAFTPVATQDVTIVPTGLELADLTDATFTFTNISETYVGADGKEAPYTYSFTGTSNIKLRAGQYKVKVDGITAVQKLTADLKVNDAAANCPISFETDLTVPAGLHDYQSVKDDTFNQTTVGIAFNNFKAHTGGHGPVAPSDNTQPFSVTLNMKKAGTVTITTCAYGNGGGLTPPAGATVTSVDGGEDNGKDPATYNKVFTITDVPAGEQTFTFNSTVYVHNIKVEYTSAPVTEDVTLTVGTDKTYQTINAALKAVEEMNRTEGVRATIMIDPGNYEEQVQINVPNVTFKNAAETPSLALTNKGVDIDANAVRITWYYGHGYDYYSMTTGGLYDAEVLAVNKLNGYASFGNTGGTLKDATGKDSTFWNSTVSIRADGFEAEGIIFENSFNQYMSAAAKEDVIVSRGAAPAKDRSSLTVGDTTVQKREWVERAAAVGIGNNSGTAYFENCAFVGRQDVVFGGTNDKVAFYDCDLYGSTDYIMGPMNALFAKCDLVLNVDDASSVDVAHITAGQQSDDAQRGYLFWNCTITSTEPNVNTASTKRAKPCDFGRPWGARCEVIWYETIVESTTTKADGTEGEATSLILPKGWEASGLGGKFDRSGEYNTHEAVGGLNANASQRSGGATVLEYRKLLDGTKIEYETWLGDWTPFDDKGKDMTITCPGGHPDRAESIAVKDATDGTSTELKSGEAVDIQLSAAVTPSTITSVDWTSSSETVTVDATGKVTVPANVAAQEVTITATAGVKDEWGDDVAATYTITVISPDPVETVTVTGPEGAASSAVDAGTAATFQLAAAVEPATADQTVTWSSDSDVVTVDQTGLVTVPSTAAPEAVTITATAAGKDAKGEEVVGTYTVTVNYVAPASDGKIVILHSNDVHGAIEGYERMAQLKADYEAAGATVLVLDAGDFSQGTTYVSVSQGATAIELMNLVGYDAATTGNHEFDYGADNLDALVKSAKFDILAANIVKNGSAPYTSSILFERDGVKIGVFGLETPETATKAHPAKIQGLSFLAEQDLYDCAADQVKSLQDAGADYIICLGHLGVDAESEPNRSIDLLNNVAGIDVFIDGHSHSTLDDVAAATNADRTVNGAILTSTGTKFANIGVVTIDAATGAITTECVSTDTVALDLTNENVKAVADKAADIKAEIEAEYGATFAETKVDLNGARAPGVRTEETNLGDLVADAMLWTATKDDLGVDEANVIAITNGGGIRDSIATGNVTKNKVNTVLPFGNTVAVAYVTGDVLLETLEASTYCTPTAVGAFPQVAGLKFTVDTTAAWDEGDLYPGSTYHKPNSINRVSIQSVNGKAFDPEATYAVVTNDFLAAGGDTYYALSASDKITDTGVPLDEALMDYITTVLGGVIGEEYAEPQGRITVLSEENAADALATAIARAKADIAAAVVSEDGSDIDKDELWVTQDALDAYQDVLDGAEAIASGDAATGADKINAVKSLNDAAAQFLAAQEYGTKKNRSGGYSTSGGNTTTTTKVTTTNDNGDTATTVTQPGGDRTITVVNAEGETVAEISLPATISAPKTAFKDVPEGHWAEESINNMASLGMVKGVNEAQDIFDMESPMTRGAVATIFYRLSNGKEGTESTFADVAADAWYADAVGWAAKTGVVNGYSAEAFGPDDAITRQQLAVMLCRFANLVGVDTKTSGTGLTAFTDGDQADDWAVSGLAWCVKTGIMKGRGDDTLDPTANITRAESAAMFDRMIALLKQ